jgi:hypothetical protein
MKHDVRIWTWNPLVPRTTLWEKGTFVLGSDPLPELYFSVDHMKNLVAGWVRMGAWTRDCEAMNYSDFRFYSPAGVQAYDILRRISWK